MSSRDSFSAIKKPEGKPLGFFGAEDEIRTRAAVSSTTPLAGEPLEPLGYFCLRLIALSI